MPKQNRNGRKPPNRLFVRVFEDGCIGGGYAYCLTPPEGFDSVEYAPVTTNQNECDHVAGMRKHPTMQIIFPVHQRNMRATYHMVYKFDFCPGCGAEIDWDKIEEEQ